MGLTKIKVNVSNFFMLRIFAQSGRATKHYVLRKVGGAGYDRPLCNAQKVR